MLRLLCLLAALVAPAVASPAFAADACVSAAAATYRHSFDGPSGSVTVTAAKALCSGQTQTFALASYTTGSATSNARPFVYSTDRGSITSARRSLTLKVVVPRCHTQVEAIAGTALQYEDANPAIALLGADPRFDGPLASYRGGGKECAPAPTVTFDNACDGSFTGTLANSDRATTDAVFLTGDRLLRLAPGESHKLTARAGSTLTIRTNTAVTYAGTWRQPATCGTPTAAPTTAPASPTPAPSAGGGAAGGPASTPATYPSVATTTATDLTGDPGAWYPATPTTPAVATSSSANSGMNPGSVLAIALGLLLIVGGGYLLVRVLRTLREEP
ncbi:hypothetical protein AB0J83_22900 [Actinoplanes sp. NPDC049596]|uniref:hypothetical protein n=1 Tax=unclassified Actinoplanes TaxID=2626549 RepID=UPI003423A651